MDIQYRKASIEDLEFLTEIRIRVLRAANGLAEDMDLSEVKRQRYQYLWKDIVSQSNFDIASADTKYGYTDLPHMMREFGRYHSMNIREAREMAYR